jgi:hypothetical protein
VLPNAIFSDSAANVIIHHPSPMNSTTTRQSLVDSVAALVEAHEDLKGQVSKNQDVAVGRLLITKWQLQTKTDRRIRKLLQKYEIFLLKS